MFKYSIAVLLAFMKYIGFQKHTPLQYITLPSNLSMATCHEPMHFSNPLRHRTPSHISRFYNDAVLVPVLSPAEVVFLFLPFTADVYALNVVVEVLSLVRVPKVT